MTLSVKVVVHLLGACLHFPEGPDFCSLYDLCLTVLHELLSLLYTWEIIKERARSPQSKLQFIFHSFLARTDPRDVARVESKTYICTEEKRESIPAAKDGVKGQLGNWMSIEAMKKELGKRFPGCMKGKLKLVHVEYCTGQIKLRKNYDDLQEKKGSDEDTFVLVTLDYFQGIENFIFRFSYVWSKSSRHTGVFGTSCWSVILIGWLWEVCRGACHVNGTLFIYRSFKGHFALCQYLNISILEECLCCFDLRVLFLIPAMLLNIFIFVLSVYLIIKQTILT